MQLKSRGPAKKKQHVRAHTHTHARALIRSEPQYLLGSFLTEATSILGHWVSRSREAAPGSVTPGQHNLAAILRTREQALRLTRKHFQLVL